ncbi:MAG TPA: lipoprotein-releasing ABC transporter permease subunit [Desulfotignum sp.]|nr:lipoprotein-releasing ABC transporter permease subunit [Desulfotignum sp.]
MAVELFIARRYLKAKRKEGFISLITFLSVAGVMVGVMALVVVIAVMSGAESEFRRRILGLEPHILLMNYNGTFGGYDTMLQDLQAHARIKDASPILFGQAMIRTRHAFSGVMVRGIMPDSSAALIKGFDTDALETALSLHEAADNLPGIILGKSLAGSVGAGPGDTIILMSTNSFVSPIGQIPSMKRFVVKGTFSSGMSEYDGMLAYVHMDQAQMLTGDKQKISAIGIWVDDIFAVKQIRQNVLPDLEYPFYARDWMEINHSLFSALKLEKTAMFIILTLIILVAAFNIASALIMMVMEKTRDIAVLKTMGATHGVIGKIFILKGLVIGVLGTCLGTIFGVVACWLLRHYDFIRLPEAYPFSTLPVQLDPLDVILIAVSAVGICFVSTLYPAYKASKMDPLEAIRYG